MTPPNLHPLFPIQNPLTAPIADTPSCEKAKENWIRKERKIVLADFQASRCLMRIIETSLLYFDRFEEEINLLPEYSKLREHIWGLVKDEAFRTTKCD